MPQRPESPPPPPAGLPPTTAHYRTSGKTQLQALAAMVALLLLACVLKGAWPPPAGVWLIIAIGVVWLGLANLRSEISAGPGWFASQGLFRRAVVRTDELVKVTEGRSGIDRIIVMKDRGGRKAGVMWGDLTQVHELRVQLAKDVRTSVDNGLVLKDRVADMLGAKKL